MPPATALEDLAVAVDDEVVAQVVPAVVVDVVPGDGEHHRRRVLRPVLVDVDGVVDEGELDLAVGRRAAELEAVAAPGAARDDRRRARAAPRRGQARAAGDGGRGVDEAGAQAAHVAAQPELELVGGPGPRRVGADRPAPGVGAVVAGGVQVRPAAPAPALAADAHLRLDPAPAPPAEPEEVEPVRRREHAGGAPARARGGRVARVEGERERGWVPLTGQRGAGRRDAQSGGRGSAELQGLAAGEAMAGHVVRNTGEGRKDRRNPARRITGGGLQRSLPVVGSRALRRSPDSVRAGRRRGRRSGSRAARRACR